MRSRTMPLVILAAFLGLAAVAGPALWQDHLDRRAAATRSDLAHLDLAASLAAHEVRLAGRSGRTSPDELAASIRALPAATLAGERTVFVSDSEGSIVAASMPLSSGMRGMSDVFADAVSTELTTKGPFETLLWDGTPVVAAVRPLPSGYLTVVQPRSRLSGDPFIGEPAHIALALFLVAGAAGSGLACMRYRRDARLAGVDRCRLAMRLETSLTQGRCGLWDWDVAAGRIYWSASMYALLGYDRRGEFLTPHEAAAILRPETGDLPALIESLSGPDCRCIEHDLRARTATGDWRWLRVKGEAVADPVDGGRHVIGFAVDVTDEREQAVRRASEHTRLREALEALSEAFVLWDAEDRLILCNSKFLGLHGIPPELAAVGTTSQAIFAASLPPLVETQLTAPPGDPDTRTIETQLSDGRWLHINERRTRDGGVVSVGNDVSELKLNEARLRERERRLQGSVRAAETAAQRYAALAERNYEANVAKTEFLARMSHELRTPLNAIIGFSDLMRQELLGPLGSVRYQEYNRDIHASGLKLLEMIEAILHMSRLEKGQIDLSPELVALDAILEDAVAAVGCEAIARNITIVTDLTPPALLHADPVAVKEVVVQLLRNAVKFSLGDTTVRVRVRSAASCLNIFVEDGGIGIAPDVLPRLGRPFEQVEAEYSRGESGSGLGLAISRALVEMHGGRLKLRSQVGIGTIAMVHIPLVQPAANDGAHECPSGQMAPLQLVAFQ